MAIPSSLSARKQCSSAVIAAYIYTRERLHIIEKRKHLARSHKILSFREAFLRHIKVSKRYAVPSNTNFYYYRSYTRFRALDHHAELSSCASSIRLAVTRLTNNIFLVLTDGRRRIY